MKFPSGYEWLGTLGQLPKTIIEVSKLNGVAEVVGRGSNKTILDWRDELNQAAGVNPLAQPIVGYSDDDIPWCGLLVQIVVFRAGKPGVKNPLWARNWATFGEPVAERIWNTLVPAMNRKPSLGDVLVFVRNGGGHVGFYVAETKDAFIVWGGNQGNRVSITAIEKERCIAVRRPPYNIPPASVKPYILARAKGPLSRNEA